MKAKIGVRASNINWLIRSHVANDPARMPGVVMRPRDVFARLQFDAQSGQRVNFGQDAGARFEIERAAFALDSGVEEFIADLGQPGIRVAGNAQYQRAVAFERSDRGFHLDGLPAERPDGPGAARSPPGSTASARPAGWPPSGPGTRRRARRLPTRARRRRSARTTPRPVQPGLSARGWRPNARPTRSPPRTGQRRN